LWLIAAVAFPLAAVQNSFSLTSIYLLELVFQLTRRLVVVAILDPPNVVVVAVLVPVAARVRGVYRELQILIGDWTTAPLAKVFSETHDKKAASLELT